MTYKTKRICGCASLLLALAASFPVSADLTAHISDQNGDPLADAIVVLKPLFETKFGEPEDTQIDQINEQFVPRVKAVQTGSSIFFPNQDQIRHHVYSFSEAKQFDIPLYSGTPSEPIRFDRPGLVVLGCNIHDQMRGYILISDSPLFAVSDSDGNISIDLELAGDYELNIWHPEQERSLDPIQISVDEELNFSADYQISTAKLFLPRRGSSSGGYF
jgi:plastocyanin